MSTIEKSIEVNVPVTIAYNQWTQFEQFPHFMEGVEEVRQIGDQGFAMARQYWWEAKRVRNRNYRAASRSADRLAYSWRHGKRRSCDFPSPER